MRKPFLQPLDGHNYHLKKMDFHSVYRRGGQDTFFNSPEVVQGHAVHSWWHEFIAGSQTLNGVLFKAYQRSENSQETSI